MRVGANQIAISTGTNSPNRTRLSNPALPSRVPATAGSSAGSCAITSASSAMLAPSASITSRPIPKTATDPPR